MRPKRLIKHMNEWMNEQMQLSSWTRIHLWTICNFSASFERKFYLESWQKILEMKMMMKTSLKLTDTHHTLTGFFCLFFVVKPKISDYNKEWSWFPPTLFRLSAGRNRFRYACKIFEYFLSRSLQDLEKRFIVRWTRAESWFAGNLLEKYEKFCQFLEHKHYEIFCFVNDEPFIIKFSPISSHKYSIANLIWIWNL